MSHTDSHTAVTIAVAAVPLEPGRHLVAAWLSAATGAGASRTRGLADVWVACSGRT